MLAQQISSLPLAGGTFNSIVVAGSNANSVQKSSAQYLGSGTADNTPLQAALDAIYLTGLPATLKLYGTFSLLRGITWAGSYLTVDASEAEIDTSATFATGTGTAMTFGVSATQALSATLASGSGTALTFSCTTAGAANGEPVFIADNSSGAALPGGISSTTQYYIINYTPTGAGTATFQLSTTQGGTTAVTGTSTGTGGSFFLAYYATCTYNTSTNVITVLGSSPPVFASGANVLFGPSLGTLPTGINVSVPNYFLKSLGSNTYGVYLDPRFVSQPSTSGGSGTICVYPVSLGNRVIGGKMKAIQGGTCTQLIQTLFSAYSIIIDSIEGFNLTTSSTTSFLRNTAYGARLNRILYQGNGFETAMSIAGGQVVFDSGDIRGANVGILINNTKNGNSAVTNCTVENCNASGISVASSAINTLIMGNKTANNNISNSGTDAEIKVVGTGGTTQNTIIVANQLQPISGQQAVFDTGIGTINLQNGPYTLASGVANGQTNSNASIATYTTSIATASYLICPSLTITSGTGTIKISVTYTDENTSQTKDFFAQGTATAAVAAGSSLAVALPPMAIRAVSGNAITVTTTVVGTITYNAAAAIQFLGP